ncbi:MAG: type IIL restriction-modification enzyme MmeI, partial [Cellulophaga sp.]|uniref:type IIL restriction-modification enzyme MmeI n=1 Tax=Cellulophaga sp. TaxID=1972202 RepID=UPI0032643E2B
IGDNKEIDFAYQTFNWTNNAKGNAGVSVVIIGLRNVSNEEKYIWSGKIVKKAKNINPYLVEGSNVFVSRKSVSISGLPKMIKGSIPADGGHLILDENEFNELSKNKIIRPFLKPFIGAQEVIKNLKRWCLYISEDTLKDIKDEIEIIKRLKGVREMRLASSKKPTIALAKFPYRFAEDRYYNKPCLIVPCVTSQRRDYIPIDFVEAGPVIYASAQAVYEAEPWVFGVINSRIHMSWVSTVAGRLREDYRYSSSICYNTFPFPKINQKQKEQINLHVFEVLEEREKHSGKTLAQLYDPNKMPKGLKEAHHQLDLAIERCYRLKPFESDTERLEYLFKEYEKMINKNTLLEKPKRTRKKKA